MTDLALPDIRRVDTTSDLARARVRKRYRAEARFKAYGLFAIALTALFLIVVLADIGIKGFPAFTQHRLVLDVKVDQAQVDPQGTGKPEDIRAGDFGALIRDAVRGLFPEVKDRAGRRLLDALLSTGAPDALRERVVADPGLIGQTVRVPVLLSDDADLYYKGLGTEIVRHTATRGIATPSGESGEITIHSAANDFSSELVRIKAALSRKASDVRRQADDLRRHLRTAEARKADFERSLATARAAMDSRGVAAFEAALKPFADDVERMTSQVKQLDDEAAALQARFDASSSEEVLESTLPSLLVSINEGLVKVTHLGNATITGQTLIPLRSTADAAPGQWGIVTYLTAEANRRVGDREVAWLEHMRAKGLVENAFNWAFFTAGDSREPELAGIRGALFGSALTLLVTLVLCLPIGVAAAIYLEEFAPKNRLTEIIEVNINNLAAVPSIVFGLLGLAIFLNFMGLPRSAPLVGGLVLALLVMPTIIIAARAAIKAVPPSIKEAALGVGASKQQAIFHHVLPLAMPGVMTGTIIGMAHALGETAPLLMIGMVAFIVEVPKGITEAATVLPVQIYLWSDLPEIAFQAKTAAAIIVLLAFLFVMNGTAIYLRRRFERRW
jgi:phosphate transport system permease protein